MVTRGSPVVYIASKLSGDIEMNVERTKEYSRFVIDELGYVPLNPILNLNGVVDEETGREDALVIDLRLLERADMLLVFGFPSEGMMLEIEAAERLGIPICCFTTDLKEIESWQV